MSTNPTRVDPEMTAADINSPLREGNLVLESLARREGLRALVAFSGLHERIRNRRSARGQRGDQDLFETERFILDEVLQLICDRTQALTQADSVVIALVEGSQMVCRAAAGPLSVGRGVYLVGESRFLQMCLESGKILQSDDCEIDDRVELDFAHVLGAHSTVVVPLRGRVEQLGVLQAFSTKPRAFSDQYIRCFDLFSELVLSALKPEDQDRRITWLSDVAEEVLRTKPAAVAAETVKLQALPSSSEIGLKPASTTGPENVEVLSAPPSETELVVALPRVPSPAPPEISIFKEPPAEIEGAIAESYEPNLSEGLSATQSALESSERSRIPRIIPVDKAWAFLRHLSVPQSSRPGLGVVLSLLAVAALFSVGAWWSMDGHGKTAKVSTDPTTEARNSPQVLTTPSVPAAGVLAQPVSDNLMNPAKFDSEQVPMTAVAESKLGALPRITGLRHWSSSIGSTVVIDMEDQVPYEVHRLMAPERIYFDLHDTALSSELNGKSMEVGDVSLTRVRIAQPVAGVTRIVLDTRDGSNFSVSMESNPYRLVVELHGAEKLAASKSLDALHTARPAPMAPMRSTPTAALATKSSDQFLPARNGRFRIVLDAGHGGWDLGTVGRQGLLEKDLVLDVTQRLGKLLQGRLGSEVMFTRTGDSYLPLDQRADFANQAQADLFVSVHANYSSLATARGVETYYTNSFTAPGSKEVERHDDGTFAKLTPVSLSAGGLHEKIEQSRRLAASVQRSLYATLATNSPDIRNRGIKDASYVVLTGTTMPAILTEISFVSSPADEHNLQSATYRQQIAEALYKGIAGYQQSAPRAKVAQLQTPTARQ